jgi:16S rRNA (cytosine967-C5)-methyltransferase
VKPPPDQVLAAQLADPGGGGRLRALVLELWQRTRMDWGFVTDRLSTTFRREKWLGAHERRLVGEVLYGLVRHLRRIDAAIARGRRTSKPPRDLERLLALLVLEKLIEPARAAQAVPELDWRAVATIDDAIAAERKLAPRIALAASLPDWLAARLVADWGDEAEPLARALNQRAPMTVRANSLILGSPRAGAAAAEPAGSDAREALALELAGAGLETRAGAWCDTALIIESRTNLFGLDAFRRGAMEAQDEGSQLLAELATAGAGPRPLIVDLCAGAGGKTLAMAARLGGRGRIVATDVDARKLEELRRRARRAAVSNARAIQLPGGAWPASGAAASSRMTREREALDALHALRGKADVVLVDAPCSGIGALRRNPEARWRLREADLAGFAAKQREILGGARALLAPGGRLVYATCTLLAVENAEVVAAILDAHPDLARVPVERVLGARAAQLGDGISFTVAPHTHGTDGFFAAVMQRAG